MTQRKMIREAESGPVKSGMTLSVTAVCPCGFPSSVKQSIMTWDMPPAQLDAEIHQAEQRGGDDHRRRQIVAADDHPLLAQFLAPLRRRGQWFVLFGHLVSPGSGT